MNRLRRDILSILRNEFQDFDYGDVLDWFDDLETHGCSSGMASTLTYDTDTIAFFHRHEDEILALAAQHSYTCDVIALGLRAFMTTMTWFAFETLAREVWDAYHAHPAVTSPLFVAYRVASPSRFAQEPISAPARLRFACPSCNNGAAARLI